MSILKKIVSMLCILCIFGTVCAVNAHCENPGYDSDDETWDERALDVTFLGNQGSGKTTILNLLLGNCVDLGERAPSLYSSEYEGLLKTVRLSDKNYRLHLRFLDTSGQKSLRDEVVKRCESSETEEGLRESNIVIFTIALDDYCDAKGIGRLKGDMEDWFSKIDSVNPEVRIILLGTRSDILEDKIKNRKAKKESKIQVEKLIKDKVAEINKDGIERARYLGGSSALEQQRDKTNFKFLFKEIKRLVIEDESFRDFLPVWSIKRTEHPSDPDSMGYEPDKGYDSDDEHWTDKTLKVTFFGDQGSGKTTVLSLLLGKHISDFGNRITTNFTSDYDGLVRLAKTKSGENLKLHLHLWDTSGQQSIREQVLTNCAISKLDNGNTASSVVVFIINFDQFCSDGKLKDLETDMKTWLSDIQKTNPRTQVILLGTQLDLVEKKIAQGGYKSDLPKAKELFEEVAEKMNADKSNQIHVSGCFIKSAVEEQENGSNFNCIINAIKRLIDEDEDFRSHLADWDVRVTEYPRGLDSMLHDTLEEEERAELEAQRREWMEKGEKLAQERFDAKYEDLRRKSEEMQERFEKERKELRDEMREERKELLKRAERILSEWVQKGVISSERKEYFLSRMRDGSIGECYLS